MKFADWLNCVDARITYDKRRELAPVEGWLSLYEDCFSVKGAIRFYTGADHKRTADTHKTETDN